MCECVAANLRDKESRKKRNEGVGLEILRLEQTRNPMENTAIGALE